MSNEDILNSQFVEAWKDIRSYTAVVWQVTSVAIAVVGVGVGSVATGTISGIPLFYTFGGWLILAFVCGFLIITLRAIYWFLSVIVTRARFILAVEANVKSISVERLTDQTPPEPGWVPREHSWGLTFFWEWRNLPTGLVIFFYVVALIIDFGMLIQTSFFQSDIITFILMFAVDVIYFIVVAYLGIRYDRVDKNYRRATEIDAIKAELKRLEEEETE